MLKFFSHYKGIQLIGETSNPSDNIEGSIWLNSTVSRLRSYVGAAVREITTNDQVQNISNKSLEDSTTNIVDTSDVTKRINFDAGGTTSTRTTIAASQTADRTLSLPDATDTLVGRTTTDTLTNKTIDGDDNTVIDLALSSLKTVLADADKFISRDGTGAVVSTLAVPSGGVVGTTETQTLTNKTMDGDDNTFTDISITSLKTDLAAADTFISRDGAGVVISTKVVPAGVVVGTTDTQTLSNKSLVDNSTNIVDNVDPTKQIGFDAGGTTGTKTTLSAAQTANRTITFPDASTTVVGTDVAQVLTNKDIDGGTASNTRRITLPKDTLANLSALTRKEGTLVYATDGANEGPYYDDGVTLSAIGSGGGGGDVYTQFTFANNQVAPANVTGFLLVSAASNGFVSDFSIVREMTDVSPVGNLDEEFASNLGSGFSSSVRGLAIIPTDSSIVAGGDFSAFNGTSINRIVKLDKDGFENTTFTTNVGTGFDDTVRAITVDSTDRILIGGSFNTFNSSTRRKLVCLSSAGVLDATFHSNLSATAFPSSAIQAINGLAVQPSDDAIIAVGNFATFNAGSPAYIVRLNSDGTEDTTFSGNVGTGFDSLGNVVTIQPSDDKILVGGNFTMLNGSGVAAGLVRLNTDGTLDTTFDTNLGTGFDQPITSIAVQNDGKILVGGGFVTFNGNARNYMVRLNSDGTEDATFYTNLGTGFDNFILAIQVQVNDDKIIAAGSFTTFDGNGLPRIARLNSDGTEDTAFTTLAGTGPSNIIADRTIVAKPNGAILAGGAFTTYDSIPSVRLLQLNVIEELNQTGTFYGTYSNLNSAWKISDSLGAFDDAGVTFSISAGGQLQYTSSNLLGTSVTQEMRWMIRGL